VVVWNRQGGTTRRRPRLGLLAGLLAAVLGLSPLGGAAAAQTAAELFNEAVEHLGRYGIVTGDPDGNLRADATLTRAEAAKILVVAAGRGEDAAAWSGEPPFPDVAPEAWYAGYVAVAQDLDLVGGYPDGTFKPRGQITYAELAALTSRLLGVEPLAGRNWPDNYLSALVDAGLVPPDLALLIPTQANQPALRGAVMVLLHYAFQHHVIDGQTYYERVFPTAAGHGGDTP